MVKPRDRVENSVDRDPKTSELLAIVEMLEEIGCVTRMEGELARSRRGKVIRECPDCEGSATCLYP